MYYGSSSGLAWSPDSKWLAYPYFDGDQRFWALFLISPETGEKRRLTNPSADAIGDTAPAFSPDGRALVFSRTYIGSSDLYLHQLGDDYKPRREPERVARVGDRLSVSPDGRAILYGQADDSGSDLMLVENFR